MVGSEPIIKKNDHNFIPDTIIAKYLISIWPSPEHYINELPYRAILIEFYLAFLLYLCYIISNGAKTPLRSISLKKYQISKKLIDKYVCRKTSNNFSIFSNAKL